MTDTIKNRITKTPYCEIITLSEKEKDIYCGAGWKIARFESGKLAGFFDPLEMPYIPEHDAQEAASQALEAAIAWLANAKGETWLVMCSSYELCEPCPVSIKNGEGVAKLGRVISEAILQIY